MDAEKKAAKDILAQSESELARMQIMEKYLNLRSLEGAQHLGKALQVTQYEISEKKKLIEYLKTHYG